MYLILIGLALLAGLPLIYGVLRGIGLPKVVEAMQAEVERTEKGLTLFVESLWEKHLEPAVRRVARFVGWQAIIAIGIIAITGVILSFMGHRWWLSIFILLVAVVSVIWLYWNINPVAHRVPPPPLNWWVKVQNQLRPEQFSFFGVTFAASAAIFIFGNMLALFASLAHGNDHNFRPLAVLGVLLAVLSLEAMFLVGRAAVQVAVGVVDFSEFTLNTVFKSIYAAMIRGDEGKDILKSLAMPTKGAADTANVANQEGFAPAWKKFCHRVMGLLFPIYLVLVLLVSWEYVFFLGLTVGLVMYLAFGIQTAADEEEKLFQRIKLHSARAITTLSTIALVIFGLALLVGLEAKLDAVGDKIKAVLASAVDLAGNGAKWLVEFFAGSQYISLAGPSLRNIIAAVIVAGVTVGLVYLFLRSEWSPTRWVRRYLLLGLISLPAIGYLVLFGLGSYAHYGAPKADGLTKNGFVLLRPDAPKLTMAEGGANVTKSKMLVWEEDPDAQVYKIEYLVQTKKKSVWVPVANATSLSATVHSYDLTGQPNDRVFQVSARVMKTEMRPDKKDPTRMVSFNGIDWRPVESSISEEEERKATAVRVEWPEARNAIGYKLQRRVIRDTRFELNAPAGNVAKPPIQPAPGDNAVGKQEEIEFGHGVTAWEGNHLENNNKYYYRLAALYPGIGWSEWSPEVFLTVVPTVAAPAKEKPARRPVEQAAVPPPQPAVATSGGDPCDKLTPEFREMLIARGKCLRHN